LNLSTTRNAQNRRPPGSKPKLDAADLAFLDYVIEKAVETFFPRLPATLARRRR
jgi:hypothetical protein